MMLRTVFIFILSIGFISGAKSVQAEPVLIDLAQDHIDITTGFNGAELIVYGIQNTEGAVHITLQGPEKDMSVHRKSKIFGIWLNSKTKTYNAIPGYYRYASSGKARPNFMPDQYLFSAYEGEEDSFQKALIRNKVRQKLFSEQASEVTYMSDYFFKARFALPPNVPTGVYTIKTYVEQGGDILKPHVTRLNVSQVGASAVINAFSRSYASLYGILCVLFAMAAGWISNSIRNRLR